MDDIMFRVYAISRIQIQCIPTRLSMSRWLAYLLALKPRLVTSSIVCSPRSSRFATSSGLRKTEGRRGEIF